MKKTKLFPLFLLVSLCLASCKEKQKDDSAKVQNTELKIKTVNIQELTELEIVTDKTQFSAVTNIQSWNFETDMNQNALPMNGLADTGEITYINSSNSLIKFPKSEFVASLACGKSDCQHYITNNQEENAITPVEIACEADLSVGVDVGMGLQYYDGYLYYIIKDGGIALCRISSDGIFKSQVALLSNKTSDAQNQIPWLIHRGNVYFWNQEEGICQVSLTNPALKNVIITRQRGADEQPILKAYGSFLYFTLPGAEKNAWLFCRYNIESGQIEQFSEIRGYLSNFVVREDKIYYQKYNENIVYQYDMSSEKNEIYFELENGDYSFYADLDYICLPKQDSMKGKDNFNGDYDILADVYTWDKVYVGVIQLEKEASDRQQDEKPISHETIHITGSDSDRIYYQSEVEDDWSKQRVISYINKSELSENGTMMKIAYKYILD